MSTLGTSLVVFASAFFTVRACLERLFPTPPAEDTYSDEYFSLAVPMPNMANAGERGGPSAPMPNVANGGERRRSYEFHEQRMIEIHELRLKMRKLIASIIENCGTTEVNIAVAKYMEIKNQNGEGKSHSDHLSDIATRLSPEIVRSMHRLAEILQEHPELAPDLLPAVEKCLSTLDFSDPRKYVGGLIPRSVPELHERETVRNASSEFLQREERRGAYEKEPAKAEIIPTLQDLLGEEVQTLTM